MGFKEECLMTKIFYLLTLLTLLLSCTSEAKKSFTVEEMIYPANLQVIKRAEWGWKSLPDTLPQHKIERITIHHGGVEFTEGKDVQAYIRNMQDWSRADKNWIDIPYHFMIDLQGIIYEARPINYPGDTNTDYDVRSHALINVMGNYEIQTLKPVQLDALINLSAYLAGQFQVDTTDIRGHKDYTETLCPGKDLYQYVQDGIIRQRVVDLLKK